MSRSFRRCGQSSPRSRAPLFVDSCDSRLPPGPCVPNSKHMGRVGFDARIFFPWDGRSPVSHPTCDVPFPPRRSGEHRKARKGCPGPPLYQGVRGSVWNPEPSRERVGDWGGPGRSGPPCVLPKGKPQDQTERGGIVLAAYAGPRAPRGGVSRKRRCTY